MNVINKVTIGSNCVIQSKVSILNDGYRFFRRSSWKKHMIKYHGGVMIGDNISINNNTVIQKGTIQCY